MVADNNEQVCSSAISNILTLRYNPEEKTFIKKASWQDFVESESQNNNSIILQLLKNVIQQVDFKEKKITIALSSGIDSSLVLALLKEYLPDVKITALTLTFSQSEDESQLSSKIANFFDIDHKIIHIENFLNELPNALNILKNPHYDVMNTYYLVKNSKKISNVLVTGDGGDEIFGGYTFRYSKFNNLVNDTSSIEEKIQSYLNCHERDWVPDQEQIFGEKIQFSWKKIYQTLRPYFNNTLSPLNQVFLADFNGKLLYNFVPNYNKFYNHFGVQSFSPFLNKEIIDYGSHLPIVKKYDYQTNMGKLILRNLLNEKIPKNLQPSSKQGFSVNTVSLWKQFGNEICSQYLLDSRLVKDNWLNGDWIKNNFFKAEKEKDIRYINKFFSLLGFEIWYRLFITKEIQPNHTL